MENTEEKKTVLVVDDTPVNLTVMIGLLQDTYKVKVANSGEKALKIALGAIPPDIILLDIMMPDMDGYEVCRRLKANAATHDIPVIFLTAKHEVEDEKHGLDLGAVDYITKPISPPIVSARIHTHLQVKAYADFLKNKTEYLEQEVAQRTSEIAAIQKVTILALASLAETRDCETGFHIRRTQMYVRALANKLRHTPNYSAALNDSSIESIIRSSPLHDIGKVGIPDTILLKPGRLSPEEFDTMKTHTTIGMKAIENAEFQLDEKVAFLNYAKEIALFHHEKWDGSGYPQGISKHDIPVCAQIMAVADVYDALVTPRVYKPAMPHQQAVAIILEGRDSHFNPDIADAFLEIQEEFAAISIQYADSKQP